MMTFLILDFRIRSVISRYFRSVQTHLALAARSSLTSCEMYASHFRTVMHIRPINCNIIVLMYGLTIWGVNLYQSYTFCWQHIEVSFLSIWENLNNPWGFLSCQGGKKGCHGWILYDLVVFLQMFTGSTYFRRNVSVNLTWVSLLLRGMVRVVE